MVPVSMCTCTLAVQINQEQANRNEKHGSFQKTKTACNLFRGFSKKCSKMCAKILWLSKKSVFAKKQKQARLDINTKRFLCSINFVKKVQLCKEHVIWCNCAVRAVPINDYIETMRVVLHVPGGKKSSRDALKNNFQIFTEKNAKIYQYLQNFQCCKRTD